VNPGEIAIGAGEVIQLRLLADPEDAEGHLERWHRREFSGFAERGRAKIAERARWVGNSCWTNQAGFGALSTAPGDHADGRSVSGLFARLRMTRALVNLRRTRVLSRARMR
jgi:hypothetical protein